MIGGAEIIFASFVLSFIEPAKGLVRAAS